LEQKSAELQMLKFGKLVDIDALQASLAINPAVEELKVLHLTRTYVCNFAWLSVAWPSC
jgi:hypothetical protein